MVAPTLVPTYRGGLQAVMRLLHKVLVRPRLWVGRGDDGVIEDILVYRGDVYLCRDPITGIWVAEVRGPDRVFRHDLI